VNELDDYLRANRDAFTREALTRRLIDEGHDPAEVEAAWARIQDGDGDAVAPISGPPRRPGIGTFLLMGAVVVGYGYVGAFGVFGILFSGYYRSTGPGNGGNNAVAMVLIAVYVVAMLVGLAYSLRRLYRAPSLRVGGAAIGSAFAMAVVVLIGINGACIAGVLASNALGAL
jgi:hypothetical protein